jgi:Domain of unknown function (DUF3598)
MKTQWECVLENLGEWVGSFTTVTPDGELIEDIPSIIKLTSVRDHQAIHLVLKRFYTLPNTTERYAKEVVWDFSTPPGIGAIYFDTGAFSSGTLAVTMGVNTIAEFSLLAGDRRWRMIQTFDVKQRLNRVTFVREQQQGKTAPERPQLNISDLVGSWSGTVTTFAAHDQAPIITTTESTFTASNLGYQLVENGEVVDLIVTSDLPTPRLLQFSQSGQSYEMLLLPDGGYTTTPSEIRLGHPFYLEIGWIYQTGQRQRLVRRYDGVGRWVSTSFVVDSLAEPVGTKID